MKFLVTVTPGPMPPPMELIQAGEDWIRGKLDDGSFECVYAFPNGGGLSIGENDSHEQLMDQLLEYPMSPFVSYDVQPLVGMDAAFERFRSYAERMQEMMAAQSG
jgi:muconolactone delta-isomerase